MNRLEKSLLKLRQSILKRYYARRSNPFVVTTLYGRDACFLVDMREKTDRLAVLRRSEQGQIEALLDWVGRHRPSLFLDIGANFGLYSVLVARQQAETKVVAFEPTPNSITRVAANILINDLENVTIERVAASDRDGTVRFTSQVAGHSGLSRVKNDEVSHRTLKTGYDDAEWEELEVETRAVDSLFSDTGKCIAIKIDTEGHERKVLEGMPELLRSNDCYVQIEISDRLPEHRDWVTTYMGQLGYRLSNLISVDHVFTRIDSQASPAAPGV